MFVACSWFGLPGVGVFPVWGRFSAGAKMIIRPGFCVAKTFPNALGFKEETRLPTIGCETLGGVAPPLPSHPSAPQQGTEPGSVTVQKESSVWGPAIPVLPTPNMSCGSEINLS